MLNRWNVLPMMTAALLLTITIPGSLAWAQVSGQTDAPRLTLKGYDPVAYFTEGRPTLGKSEFERDWDEARYRFASAQHMTLFRAEPDRYAPQFAGSCAAGMSMGMKVEANPENWLIHDGRLFVFRSPAAQALFQADRQGTAAAGYANWEKLKDAPIGTKLTQ
ncbi:YHS domain-containing (seleno)protein [Bradyrhizobium sp.]|uniref:YHS domain-containing (seleno)protein n=1 Tax=Bradyrhizobium sp. TaxID=376 RepID=UPI0040384523